MSVGSQYCYRLSVAVFVFTWLLFWFTSLSVENSRCATMWEDLSVRERKGSSPHQFGSSLCISSLRQSVRQRQSGGNYSASPHVEYCSQFSYIPICSSQPHWSTLSSSCNYGGSSSSSPIPPAILFYCLLPSSHQSPPTFHPSSFHVPLPFPLVPPFVLLSFHAYLFTTSPHLLLCSISAFLNSAVRQSQTSRIVADSHRMRNNFLLLWMSWLVTAAIDGYFVEEEQQMRHKRQGRSSWWISWSSQYQISSVNRRHHFWSS